MSIPNKNSRTLEASKVISQQQIGENAYLLKLERRYDFVPGQVVGVSVSEEIPARLYSIASGKTKDYLSILYTVVPDGILTQKLSKLKSGDQVYMSPPFGNFTGEDVPAYWIAAGTGLAPFLSMMESGFDNNKILIHGSRFTEGFFFQNNLKDKFGKDYIRCCSAEQKDDVYFGRLTTFLMEQQNLPKEYKYYLCGSSEMVVQTRDILISKGIPFENILSEIYF
ncbi:MAG: hypothetical protein JEZ03_10950 [Bacteroidales bacterium]|nr:hypothetical protein [Bacteroidales bacterium]